MNYTQYKYFAFLFYGGRMGRDCRYQELYSESFIYAISGVSKFSVSKPIPDYGMDFILIAPKNEIGWNPKIDIQLKSSYNYSIKENVIKYRLESKNYNDLIVKRTSAPRLLIFVPIPKQIGKWVNLDPNGSVFNYCSYWCNLMGKPKTCQGKVSIEIPQKNIFSPNTLEKMNMNISIGMEIDYGL